MNGGPAPDPHQAVRELGEEFWEWRIASSFRSADDIPRVDHPPDWRPRFDRASARERLARAGEFLERWRSLDTAGAPVGTQVDYRLVGSAIRRVEWEVGRLAGWERDAVMQLHQALGPAYDLMLPLPPFDRERQEGVLFRLDYVDGQLETARENLSRAGTRQLAELALKLLRNIDSDLPQALEALSPLFDGAARSELAARGEVAARALVGFREWLAGFLPQMPSAEPVGREAFLWYLRNVALLPHQPEVLLLNARRELERASVWEEVAANRNRSRSGPTRAASAEEQVETQIRNEQEVREFYERHDLLSQPDALRRYHTAVMPPYVERLRWLGVFNDLTSDLRLHQDGVSYTISPAGELQYFAYANAHDPRLGIVHEGAHFKQLTTSWAHPNPLRHRYYDSVPNEGIAFYNEEMMLQAGLFDDAPWSQQAVHNMNRLRCLRTIVDVGLVTGEISPAEGVETFMKMIPIDEQTALEETALYVACPGLAMSYMVGKLEIIRLLHDAKQAQGKNFSLRSFHDFLWQNGNLPLSLLRWELLNDDSDLKKIDQATAGER